MVDTAFSFNGVGFAEARDRENEVRGGLPPQTGFLEAIFSAPIEGISKVEVVNVGPQAAHVRMKVGNKTVTRTNEYLVGLAVGGNRYTGRLANKTIVPGSVSITNGGAPLTVVDDGEGVLHDTGVPTATRGTINYDTGVIDLQYGAPPTEPVLATYQHNDWVDFASAAQSTTKAAAAYPFTIGGTASTGGIGRVNPFSIAISESGGAKTFTDDGKGNMVETTGAGAVKRGTVDYLTGIVTLTAGSAPLAGTVTMAYTFNPYGQGLAVAGSNRLLDLRGGGLPELTLQPFGAGAKGNTKVALCGETRFSANDGPPKTTSVVAKFFHFGADPFRVREEYPAFPRGGQSNDPNA